MNGILLIDKPLDWTSFDVVAKIRGILKSNGVKLKVGHSGTLDPKATGLLIILIGDYTKRAENFTKLDKTYKALICLGETSSTGDEEGIKQQVSTRQPEQKELQRSIDGFIGAQQQLPHAYSAVKVNGQRAYELARRGQIPELKPRPIHIYELKLESYDYPLAELTAKVSSGTYIRSLAEDIGKTLGTGAYLKSLRRIEVGDYTVNDATGIDLLNIDMIKQRLKTA